MRSGRRGQIWRFPVGSLSISQKAWPQRLRWISVACQSWRGVYQGLGLWRSWWMGWVVGTGVGLPLGFWRWIWMGGRLMASARSLMAA